MGHDSFNSRIRLKALNDRAPTVIKDLLKYLELHRREDYPQTCGACGTSDACCDMDCMEAASMARHDASIYRAQDWLRVVKSLK